MSLLYLCINYFYSLTNYLNFMKKIVLTFVFSVTIMCVFSQSNARFGIVGGMNVSKFGGNAIANVLPSRIGFHAGPKAEISLSMLRNVYLDASALLSLKGTGQLLDEGNRSLYYLEVPLRIGYKYPMNNTFSVFGKAGPYVGFGLFGSSIEGYEDNPFSDDEFGYKRFDFGLGVKAGVEISNKYQASIGYDWGLINIDNSGSIGFSNRNLSVSLAYLF